jgi:hypothetical protein
MNGPAERLNGPLNDKQGPLNDSSSALHGMSRAIRAADDRSGARRPAAASARRTDDFCTHCNPAADIRV